MYPLQQGVTQINTYCINRNQVIS